MGYCPNVFVHMHRIFMSRRMLQPPVLYCNTMRTNLVTCWRPPFPGNPRYGHRAGGTGPSFGPTENARLRSHLAAHTGSGGDPCAVTRPPITTDPPVVEALKTSSPSAVPFSRDGVSKRCSHHNSSYSRSRISYSKRGVRRW